jgi:hypothetical protein
VKERGRGAEKIFKIAKADSNLPNRIEKWDEFIFICSKVRTFSHPLVDLNHNY